ncbi:DUF5683 domain-containing protein [Salegentibacter sp. HM20]
MNKTFSCLVIFILFFSTATYAQQDSIAAQPEIVPEEEYEPYDPLAPARAAFYSAILPGLGQAYNKKYWKIPIAYGGLATGIYFYINNDKEYNRFRDAYKDRLAGRPNELDGRITNDGLLRAQRFYRRNKEISLLVTAGVYILNIIDANIDAHLRQFNVSEDLSLHPKMNFDEFSGKTRYGLSLNYSF